MDRMDREIFGVIGICGTVGNLAARVLMDHGFKVIGTDLKSEGECEFKHTLDNYDIELYFSTHPKSFFDLSTCIVPPPSLEKKSPVFKKINESNARLMDVEGLIERFQPDKPIIYITGTNGKTTTVSLMKHICYHIGLKPTEHNLTGLQGNAEYIPPLQSRLNGDVAVLETGISGNPGDLRFIIERCKPSSGVITNITPDHLKKDQDFLGYARIKGELVESLKNKQIIINSDDPTVYGLVNNLDYSGDLITFGVDYNSSKEGKKLCWCGRELSINETIPGVGYYSCECGLERPDPDYLAKDIKDRSFTLLTLKGELKIDLKIMGLHNIYNALGAFVACREFLNVDIEEIRKAMKTFEGVPGRLEYISTFKGKEVIIDYGHNPCGVETVLRELRKIYNNKKIAAVITISSESGEVGDIDILKRSVSLADFVIPASFYSRKVAKNSIYSEKILLTDNAPDKFRKGHLGATSNQVVEGLKTASECDADIILCLGEAAVTYKQDIKTFIGV
ncbi:MAG: Mur ligase [Euryarchaeota archaeon]|nr:Mur ligase [Euryarchaeota archaeon]